MKKGIKRGITLGAATSQPIGNYVMSEVDHLIKDKYHAPFYCRYSDDVTILAHSLSEAKFLLSVYEHLAETKVGVVVKSSAYYGRLGYETSTKRRRKRKRAGHRFSRLRLNKGELQTAKTHQEAYVRKHIPYKKQNKA